MSHNNSLLPYNGVNRTVILYRTILFYSSILYLNNALLVLPIVQTQYIPGTNEKRWFDARSISKDDRKSQLTDDSHSVIWEHRLRIKYISIRSTRTV